MRGLEPFFESRGKGDREGIKKKDLLASATKPRSIASFGRADPYHATLLQSDAAARISTALQRTAKVGGFGEAVEGEVVKGEAVKGSCGKRGRR